MGGWWRHLFKPSAKPTLHGMAYAPFCTLYSADGAREVKILVFANGQTFLEENERLEDDTFANRHGDRPVGPFASPDEAERFIVATPWFRGEEA